MLPTHGRSGSKIAPIAPASPVSNWTAAVTMIAPPARSPTIPRAAYNPRLRTDVLMPSVLAAT